MSLVVNRRRTARRDLIDVFNHYVDEGTPKTARRFLAQAESTFQRLPGCLPSEPYSSPKTLLTPGCDTCRCRASAVT